MLSGEGFYSCSILFQLIHDRYVKMLLDTNGGFAQILLYKSAAIDGSFGHIAKDDRLDPPAPTLSTQL